MASKGGYIINKNQSDPFVVFAKIGRRHIGLDLKKTRKICGRRKGKAVGNLGDGHARFRQQFFCLIEFQFEKEIDDALICMLFEDLVSGAFAVIQIFADVVYGDFFIDVFFHVFFDGINDIRLKVLFRQNGVAVRIVKSQSEVLHQNLLIAHFPPSVYYFIFLIVVLCHTRKASGRDFFIPGIAYFSSSF